MACSLASRVWRLEPWGYPARFRFAITHLKFPAGSSDKGRQQKLRHLALAYRLFLVLYWTFWVLYSSLGGDGPPTSWWCVYVTDWNAALMGGYFWAALLAMLFPRTRFLDTSAWVLHDVASPLSFMVAMLYWSTWPASPISGIIINFHGVNAFLMACDLALSRYPYHLKHIFPAAGFIISYLIFNGLYWRYTGTVIYAPLNYSEMLPALVSIFGTMLVILPCTHFLCWRWELAWFACSEKRRYLLARETSVEDLVPSPHAHGAEKEEGRNEGRKEEEEEQQQEQQLEGGEEELQRSVCGDMEEGREGGVAPSPPHLSDLVLATRRVLSLEDQEEEGGREGGRERGMEEEEVGGSPGARGVVLGDEEDNLRASPGKAATVAPV